MRVPKATDTESLTPKGQDAVDPALPQRGEFDAVLADKKARHPGAKPTESGSPASGRPGSGASTGGRGGVGAPGRPRPEGGPLERGRPPGPGLPGGGAEGTAQTRAEAREAAAREALSEADPEAGGAMRGDTTLAGNLVAPHHARWEPAGSAGVDAANVADAVRTADVAARVERIAELIVRAAEVRLHSDGSAEARLQLDLGHLGRMDVALARTAEGRIHVTLSPASAEGASLLQARGQELAQRLEARGLNLQELRVESSGETVLRVQGAEAAEKPTVVAETTRAQAEAGETAPRQQQRHDDEGERRGRREPDTESGEED